MPTFENPCLTDNATTSHPVSSFPNDSQGLKQLLLELSKRPELAVHKSTLRSAANRVRETAFGYNRSATKKKILKLLQEFYQLEIDDLTDETKIAEKEIRAGLEELIAAGRVKRGHRRRWQEPGKHYNELFLWVPPKEWPGSSKA